jgi:hypothetical protein
MSERPARCQHRKANGEPCQANAMSGSPFCFFHDPEMVAERTEARRAGGQKNKAAVLPTETPDRPLTGVQDVVALLGETINQVRRGQIDPKVSNAVGYLAGILLKALEQGDLEQRLAALESIVKGRTLNAGTSFDTGPREFLFEPVREKTPA